MNPPAETREVLRRWPTPRQLAVAGQSAYEKHDKVDRDQIDDRTERDDNERDDQAKNKKRLDVDNEPVRNQRIGLKSNDQGQKIKRKRQHPQ